MPTSHARGNINHESSRKAFETLDYRDGGPVTTRENINHESSRKAFETWSTPQGWGPPSRDINHESSRKAFETRSTCC